MLLVPSGKPVEGWAQLLSNLLAFVEDSWLKSALEILTEVVMSRVATVRKLAAGRLGVPSQWLGSFAVLLRVRFDLFFDVKL